MIGIYHDDFVTYLKDNLGDPIKTTSKNIVVRCPWCEYNKESGHYHLYISLEAPIFHCFHASCEQRGTIKKLLKKIQGHDISEKFVSRDALNNFSKQNVFKPEEKKKVIIPKIKSGQFPNKEIYIKKRLKFANIHLGYIKGLIFDINEFLNTNQIPIDQRLFRMRDYLHSNFVGFLNEQHTTVIFRNIDDTQSFKHYKLKLADDNFLDYYKLNGHKRDSKTIILAEGIFDIFSEHIYDTLNLKDKINLYASSLSSNYRALIQSIVFHEQIFRPKVVILSDMGIDTNYYKKLKKFNSHIIDSLTIYYNIAGKDFNDTPVITRKFVI